MAVYPLTSFYFNVAIVGAESRGAGFQEVSGLGAEREIEEIVEGGENSFIHRLPKRVRHQNIVLKRGLVDHATELFLWCARTLESDLQKPILTRDMVVTLLDPDGKPIVAWNCARAWPVKMDFSPFNAKESEIAIETLEFAYQSLQRVYVSRPA